MQVSRWCFTLNNYSDDEVAALVTKGPQFKYIVFGKEVGDSGTPHLQGFVIFNHSLRINSVKRLIGNRCHVEPAKGTSKQAADYCKKDGDFQEFGDIPVEQGKRKDWDAYKEFVIDLGRIPSKREVILYNPSLYARYSNKCFEIAEAFLDPPKLVGDTEQPRFGWQSRVCGRIGSVPSRRSIDFVVDPQGAAGKSWVCRYALSKYPEKVQVLRIGKRDDLAYSIDETKSIFLFDVPRDQMQFLQYSVLESLKDQMIFSPKYESKFKVLRHVPYVAVFSNEAPDLNKLTHDRFNLINVVSTQNGV